MQASIMRISGECSTHWEISICKTILIFSWMLFILLIWFMEQETSMYISMRPRQNGRHFTDDIFKFIFLNENIWISLKISLKFVPKVRINKIPALVQIMAWRRPGDKPLSEPMMVNLLTHICVTRPQWDICNVYNNNLMLNCKILKKKTFIKLWRPAL